ncbi:MAG: polysaccharide biosynthesis C-terminal domain-containing protein, partial [Paludibacteraceae bacterium]|nr:polysaccharide biosynthesis C-terminal domain-containing protein [Paludibacteraceae bacterium]
FIFIVIIAYIDIFKLLLGPQYREGIRVIPIVLMAYFLQGVMYNLSLWYKLIDRTIFGAWFSIVGFIVTLIINIVFIPMYSYMASAWASLASAVVMVVLSYVFGQKYYPIHYKLKTLGLYFGLALVLLAAMYVVSFDLTVVDIVYRTALVVVYVAIVMWREWPLLRPKKSVKSSRFD